MAVYDETGRYLFAVAPVLEAKGQPPVSVAVRLGMPHAEVWFAYDSRRRLWFAPECRCGNVIRLQREGT